MQLEKLKSQNGISVIEIMIVLVITAILVTFAVAQLGSSKTNFTRQNYARELKVSLERARFDSVKRRAENWDDLSRITLENATSFSVLVDLNQDGVVSSSEIKKVSLSSSYGIKIVGNNLVFPISIRFNRRGQVIVVDGTSTEIPAYFIVCSNNCTYQTANAANSSIIYVSATGTVTMTEGGSTLPNFQNPSVTNVSSNSGVNPWVGLPQENSNPTANTLPSPTPTISPTTTPTPSPTATPVSSPTATPVSSPTPRFCNSGERPAATGCYCNLPMTVRSSGKCI